MKGEGTARLRPILKFAQGRVFIALLIAALLCSMALNLFLIVRKLSLENKNSYHLTEVCELSHLLEIRKRFPKGTQIAIFKTICDKAYSCLSVSQEGGRTVLNLFPLPDCPASYRQYCGLFAEFHGGRMVDVYSGYPCH
jgi:hypothetical protein